MPGGQVACGKRSTLTKSCAPMRPSTDRRGLDNECSNIARLKAIAANSPSSMPNAMTAATAVSVTSRSRCQRKYGWKTAMRNDLLTAWMTMAASIGSGMRSIHGRNSSTSVSTVSGGVQAGGARLRAGRFVRRSARIACADRRPMKCARHDVRHPQCQQVPIRLHGLVVLQRKGADRTVGLRVQDEHQRQRELDHRQPLPVRRQRE